METTTPRPWFRSVLLAVAMSSTALTGCFVSARPSAYYGYDVDYDESIPADIYGYPSAPYNGGYAYWVNDRWYYNSPRGWAYFRNEPTELYHYRSAPTWRYYRPGGTVYAPPAYYGGSVRPSRGGYGGTAVAPPAYAPRAYGPAPAPAYAPPASTVRRPGPGARPGTAPPAR